ncbi:FKBP-type peptidyl-prolyl cis-trans isomerase [Actinospica durhamensis]|uniref:peptidylprolyl isomerase n=1 Tax=Actinospica durhamensis TaxID=1508375 RepID=A0A941ILT6_9ACTN|nr:FKBP-type peptidyl-prolyl cis-trans isomerase [Actinospica durhamensis]MBR7832109.1 FKBP-type peptidyl-prolyl cis-trans isomerase [Actinospica durhamensis]
MSEAANRIAAETTPTARPSRGSRGKLALSVVLLAGLMTAGCSSSTPTPASSTAAGSSLPVTSGSFGQAAVITPAPGSTPSTTLETKVLVQGTGQALAKGDLAVINFTAYNWSQKKSLGDSYASTTQATASPQSVQLGSSSVLPAWNTALTGAKVGSRIEVAAPPADAFGTAGNSQAGVGATDVLIFVFDVVGGYPANAQITGTMAAQTDASLPKVVGEPGSGNPTVTIPTGVKPPTGLVSKVLIQGTGATVAKGQTLLMQYTGVDWNTGKNFDSSFTRKTAFSTAIGEGAVIAGWDQGLVGKHVGDRVLLVIPPSLGYGPQGGQSSAGIGKDDTLVFVVDIVAAF